MSYFCRLIEDLNTIYNIKQFFTKMKRLTKCLFLVVIFMFVLLQACIDKDYDDFDKSGVLPVPPIGFKVDTIELYGLPEGIKPEEGGIPIPNGSVVLTDTINSLFAGDAIKDFFFEGAGDVKIAALIDAEIAFNNVKVDLYFSIIDSDRKKIENIKLPVQTLTPGKDREIGITIGSQYMQYMQNAKDLELTVVASANGATVWIDPDDYIFIKQAVVKTGGMHFEL